MKLKIIKRNFDFDTTFETVVPGYTYKIDQERIDNVQDVEEMGNSQNEPTEVCIDYIQIGYNGKYGFVEYREGRELPSNFPLIYLYKGILYGIDKDQYIDDEIKLLIKEHFYKHNEKFKKLQKEIKLFESIDNKIDNTSREPIPERVRFSVWRRDEGKCVQCGSNKKLEFDHIIPLSKGGSSTERNLQLLCEKCNGEKSSKI